MTKCVKGVGYISMDMKKDLIDSMKDDYRVLGDALADVYNTALSYKRSGGILSKQKNSQVVLTGVEEPKESEKVAFYFECYDVDNEEHEKVFLEKLHPEDKELYGLNKSLKEEN